MKIQIVGCDPAMRNFGFAKATLDLDTMEYKVNDLILIQSENEAGKTVRKNSDDIRRARVLYEGMIEACNGSVIMVAEVPVGSQSARAMASYGICAALLAACPIPLIEVTPSEVKLAAVGFKTASKEEMIAWAMAKFPDAPWKTRMLKGKRVPVADNEHLADAVAAIEAGLKTQQFKQAAAFLRAQK